MVSKVINSIESVFAQFAHGFEIKMFFGIVSTYVISMFSNDLLLGILILGAICAIDWFFAMHILATTDKIADSKKFAKKGIDFIVYVLLTMTISLLIKTADGVGTVVGNLLSYADNILVFYFACGEVLSVFEHASEKGYKVPTKFLQDISKTRDNLTAIKK